MINTTVKHGYLFPPITSELETCKKVQKSAITIQKTWRGFKVRKQFSKPPKSGLNPICGAIPVGNDPISHLERYITVKKHPAILATGGAQCLFNAINMTKKADGQLGKKPKIFIIDFSPAILKFWQLLKRSFNDSESIESFLEKLPKYSNFDVINMSCDISIKYPTEFNKEEKFSQWLVKGTPPFEAQKILFKRKYPELDINDYHPRELYKYFEQLFNSDHKRFNWIKNVVINHVYLIEDNWVNSRHSFQFVKRICDHHDYEIFVYASNIEDCNYGCSEKLWDNIRILKPTMVVKTNTKWLDDDTGYPISTEYISIPDNNDPWVEFAV